MNQIAAQFIKAHEGCKLAAYRDSAGIWTIGYGATGPEVHEGAVWTQQQADARLESDIARFEAGVKRCVKVPLSDKQAAALISFAFNLGEASLASSTLLTMLNQGDVIEAAKQFHRWDKAGGHELKGLLIRRFDEASLFLQGS